MSDRHSHHFGLVLDCTDHQRLAQFWAVALDSVNVGSAGIYVAPYPRDGHGPKLLLQQVTDAKTPRTGCTSTSTPPTSKPKPSASTASAPSAQPRPAVTNTATTGS